MKIALVKQDIYQDLYVCGKKVSGYEALESSLMRIGPLSLINDFDADYYIIKEQKNKECQAYKHSYKIPKALKDQLKTLPAANLTESVFAFLKPLSVHSHADFAISPYTIDWSLYDCVISINVSIPTKIVKKYSSVLWCYMYGEANADNSYPHFGYDVVITQNLSGEVSSKLGKVDFPYTFLGPKTLENIASEKFGLISVSEKTGIYAEINNTTERPVTKVSFLENLPTKTKHDVILHDQNVVQNLHNLYKAKYFVKLQGRKIRGNSVIESISAGTLVLMNPKDVTHSQLLPKETWIHNQEELIKTIDLLDQNPDIYLKLLTEQRKLLQFFVVDTPIESLENALKEKRLGSKPEFPTLKDIIKKILCILGLR